MHRWREHRCRVFMFAFLENLRTKGLEILHMVDPVDEHAVQKLKEFDRKNPKSTTKEGLDLGDEDGKKKVEELKAQIEPLTKLMKEVLGVKVEKVVVSENRRFPFCSDDVRARLVCQYGAHGIARQLDDFLHGVQEDHGGQSNALHYGGVEQDGRQTNLTRRWRI